MSNHPRLRVRLVLVSGLAITFIIYFLFFLLPSGPDSPSVRAPGHLDKTSSSSENSANTKIADDLLKGSVVMPKLGNETAKAELGRSTWRFFHTMMARYPEEPTEEEQETLRSFVYLFSRLYPCGECAAHFQQHLKKYPPQVSSRSAAAGWACFIHNEINVMLEKPVFDCNDLGDFYDCGCADDKTTGDTNQSKPGKKADGKVLESENLKLPVEITKESLTRGG